MIVGVPRETFANETRVALVPADVPTLKKAGLEVRIETGCGTAAGYLDAAYEEKGASVLPSRSDLFAAADIVVQVRAAGASPDQATEDMKLLRAGQAVIGFMEPLWEPQLIADMAGQGVQAFSMDLMPRISRAQSMDALSAMANIAGYKAVLLAASEMPRMFPMLMTAAGTITPARVFVIGAGVAGLQAIATAKRLGAKVEGYDIRPVVKDQVESVGAKFIELDLDTGESEGKGGYAKAMGEEFYRRQRELLGDVMAHNDVVITTAAIPGRKSPLLVTRESVGKMAAGSVIIDMAAERGGNCELTRPDEVVIENNVKILGPTNLPSSVAYHASQMYSRTITNFLRHLVKEGELNLDMDDEITRDTLLTNEGDITNERVRDLLGAGSSTP